MGDSLVIDVFNHVYPDEYLNALSNPIPFPFIAQRIKTVRTLRDMEYRTKVMDKLGIDMQIISLGRPAIDDLNEPVESFPKITTAANDGVAKIVEKFPKRFAGIGTVSLINVENAIDELERCVKDLGFLGVQILSNVRGKPLGSPEFEPFYEKITQFNAGLWIHPTDMRQMYGWAHDIMMDSALGWDLDESFGMLTLVSGGVLERHPDLKIITHHMGSYIPFLASRIDRTFMLQGKNGLPPPPMKKRPMEYLKMFNVDTAEGSWRPALVCSHMFYGSDKLLFGSDYPMHGDDDLEETIKAIKELNASEEEKSKILGGNAMKLLNISG